MEITALVDVGRLLLQPVAPVGNGVLFLGPRRLRRGPARDILAWFRNRAGGSYVSGKGGGGVRHDTGSEWYSRLAAFPQSLRYTFSNRLSSTVSVDAPIASKGGTCRALFCGIPPREESKSGRRQLNSSDTAVDVGHVTLSNWTCTPRLNLWTSARSIAGSFTPDPVSL